jgi:hypothetical protein
VGNFSNYYKYVSEQAQELFDDNRSDFFSSLEDSDIDVYDFFDSAIHNWVDNDFIYIDLHDCADILESSNEVESDSGLWEGQDPIKAVEAMAFFTYRNDLMYAVKEVVAEELETFKDNLNKELEGLENEKERLDGKRSDLETEQADLDEEDEDYDSDYDEFEKSIDELGIDIDLMDEKISEMEYTLQYAEDTLESI